MLRAQDADLDVRAVRHEIIRNLDAEKLAAGPSILSGLGRRAHVVAAPTPRGQVDVPPRLRYLAAFEVCDDSGEHQSHWPGLAAIQFLESVATHAKEVGRDSGVGRPAIAASPQEAAGLTYRSLQLYDDASRRHGAGGGH